MSRLIRLAILLVVILGLLQWVVPAALAQGISQAIVTLDHDPKPIVKVTAIPFWEASQGKFQDINVKARQLHAGPLLLSQFSMDWQKGQLDIGDLLQKRITVIKPGMMTVAVTIDESALTQFLNQSGIQLVKNVKVSINPNEVSISGKILLGKIYVPLTMNGHLSLSGDQTAVIFHPQQIDGLKIPVSTTMTVFTLSELKLPEPLKLTAIQLGAQSVRILARSR